MKTHTLETNQQLILENEQALARQLAGLVLEKPVPPIWMIFIPIFFVFHAWRIKGYAKGLDDFVDQFLVSRRRALEEATESIRTGNEVDFEAWLNKATDLQPPAKPLYRQWMTLLVEQYRTLLTAHGDSYPALVRSGYQKKTTYLLFRNQLSRAEHAYSLALLPQIEGESEVLQDVLERMNHSLIDLHRQESDRIFS